MNFEDIKIKKQQTHRITLEIDVIGSEEDFDKCEKLSQAFSAFITQWWWLADSRFEFVCSTRVKTLTQQKKDIPQVKLPTISPSSTNGNGKIKQSCALK